MLAVVCALLSALMYGAASVLQQRTAAAEPAESSLRLGLLTKLARSPAWLLGIVADVIGFVLQFVALSTGTLVVVQPLLVCGLLFALPLGARVGAARLRRSDAVAALAVCAGLSVFLLVARPATGHSAVRFTTWVAVLVPSAAVVAALVWAAVQPDRLARHKAVLLSAVAGLSYGVAAALIKDVSHLLGRSIVGTLGHWQLYVLIIIGIGGMLVAQSAFQAGSLDASLPTMTVVDPVVSILIGAFAFGESITVGLVSGLTELAAIVVMVLGVFALARSNTARSLHAGPPARRVS